MGAISKSLVSASLRHSSGVRVPSGFGISTYLDHPANTIEVLNTLFLINIEGLGEARLEYGAYLVVPAEDAVVIVKVENDGQICDAHYEL